MHQTCQADERDVEAVNRSQRRAKGSRKTGNVTVTYTLSKEQLEEIKEQATNDAVDRMFGLMLGLPVMVLHDNFGRLMKKEGREERFVDMVLDLFGDVQSGEVPLQDVIDTLKAETGVDVVVLSERTVEHG